jgi:Fe2+ or Zn2+ uptake regulation protein
MKEASKKFAEHLKSAGCRITKARLAVFECLYKQNQPQAINEIVDKVSIDQASVYRIIQLFKELSIVEEILSIDKKSLFSLSHGHHHHHIVCEKCGLVEHLPCESVVLPKQVPASFVSVDSHELVFYGSCKSCLQVN